MRWITQDPEMEAGERARLYFGASLGRVDNVFELTRRFLSPLERPVLYAQRRGGTRSGTAMRPYNPDMVLKYLDLFRVVNNFIHTGSKDGADAPPCGSASPTNHSPMPTFSGRARRIPRPRRKPPQGARAQALKGCGGMRRRVSVPDAAQAAAGLQPPPVGPRLPEGRIAIAGLVAGVLNGLAAAGRIDPRVQRRLDERVVGGADGVVERLAAHAEMLFPYGGRLGIECPFYRPSRRTGEGHG